MINNAKEDLYGDTGESLVPFDFDSLSNGMTIAATSEQNAIKVVSCDKSSDTLVQMAADSQDKTKPYRIFFRGELVHD